MLKIKSSSWSYFKLALSLLFISLFFNGCFPNSNYYEPVAKKDGIYDITGWGYSSCYCPSGALCNCSSKDIDGKVGYKLSVGGPLANCIPGGKWTYSTIKTVSGSFPPGLSLNSWGGIDGIPTKRGHWIVKLEIDNLYCNDVRYYGIKEELRFHITGSGRVNY